MFIDLCSLKTVLRTKENINMKQLILIVNFTFFSTLLFCQSLNVDLFAQFHRGDERYSGSWSYVAPDGSEYALIGAKSGTAIYAIDDADNIEEVGFIPGPSSNWREIIVVADHAYVTTEGSSIATGMQVIDLTDLPNSASLVITYNDTFSRGHIIQKDIFSDDPYVYVCGTTSTEGVHIINVSEPSFPQQVGLYDPGYYIHDCHVRGDVMFAAAFYEGQMDIVDISNKSNPTLITSFSTPGGRTHSSSMSEDGKYLFVAPEQDGLLGTIWNIEDLENPYQVATYTANTESLVHNPYVLGDFAFVSHNTEGLRVVDFTDPELPVEVGYYDTFDGPSGGFFGLWSACPYLPSGKILGGNRTDGLYIWTFNGTRAARAYGLVRDSLSQEPIVNATIMVEQAGTELNSDLTGNFKYGDLAGTFTFTISAENYIPKTVTVDIAEGASEELIIDLASLNPTAVNEVFQAAVNVYPNPANDYVEVDLGSHVFNGQINLTNSLGQVVKSQISPEREKIRFDLQNLPRGNYQMEFRDQQQKLVARKPLVVQ